MLKEELVEHRRSRRRMRHAQSANTARQPRGRIIGGLSIRDHPAEEQIRRFPVIGKGNLITGSQSRPMATLVDCQFRFTLSVKVQGNDTISMVKGLSTQIRQLPAALRWL